MDNKDKIGTPDKNLINLNEKYEVEYWTKTLGITAEELREIVKSVGNSVKDVKEKLAK